MAVARRRWWVVALTTIFAVSVAVGALKLIKPSYTGTATLQAPISTGVSTPTDLTYLDRLMNTYTQLAQQPTLKAEVARRLGGPAPSLSVAVEANTELLQLSATDHSPSVAWRAANIAAGVLVARAAGLERATSSPAEAALASQLGSLSNQITKLRIQLASLPSVAANNDRKLALSQEISGLQANYNALVAQRAQLQLADATRNQSLAVVQSASIPTSPSSPRWVPVLALAFGLGLLGGLALAFLLERVMPRLYTVAAIEAAASADVLAAIPRVSTKLVAESSLFNGASAAQEAFGVLAVRILAEASRRPLRTILVTSRGKGDGKSTVAANLAAELARIGRSVVLVDADMRAPSIDKIFDIDGDVGLSNLLERADRKDTPQLVEWFIVHPDAVPALDVIPAGPMPAAPARLLASNRLSGLVDELTQSHRFVVFDAPPLTVSDPLSIAALADLIVLVVGGTAVPDRDIQAATRELSGIGAGHVSVVVNRMRANEPYYAYGYRATGS
jgi:capsular exopolysaccharide synthesis family protein